MLITNDNNIFGGVIYYLYLCGMERFLFRLIVLMLITLVVLMVYGFLTAQYSLSYCSGVVCVLGTLYYVLESPESK